LARIGSIQRLAATVDRVQILGDDENLRSLFAAFPFSFNTDSPSQTTVNVASLDLDSLHKGSPWNLPPIIYDSGGLLGDFLQQLGIVHSFWLTTGRKGIVNITNSIKDSFRMPIEKTYGDLKELVVKQPYIEKFLLEATHKADYNLSAWRKSPMVYKTSWEGIFNSTYPGCRWGRLPWLTCDKLERFANATVISTSIARPNWNYPWNELDPETTWFVSQQEDEYTNFLGNTGAKHIRWLCPTTFEKWCILINSCKLFIGNCSMPLAIAHACHTPRIILREVESADAIHILNMESIWKNVSYRRPL
jgi:hypothetical protein